MSSRFGQQVALSHVALCIIAATFVLQPLNLRPYGLPVSLVLIAIFAAVAALKEGRLSFSRDVLFFAPIFIILFVVDFLVAGQTRSLVFLILIIFVRFCGASFSGKQLSDTLFIVGLVCFFVSLVGVYRYHFGYDIQDSENPSGISQEFAGYSYMGISYLPSTRNSDAIYFAVGFIIFLHRGVCGASFRALNITAAIFLFYAVLMSLSRGVWLAVLCASIALLGWRRVVLILLPVSVLALILVFLSNPFVFGLALVAVLSLFDAGGANELVSGFYKYSNEDRFFIYSAAVSDFIANPFGYGVNFSPSYARHTGAKSVHSENIYLDFLLILGVFSAPIFISIIRGFRGLFLIGCKQLRGLAVSLATFLLVFHVFNSGIDFVFVWFLVGLIYLIIASQN